MRTISCLNTKEKKIYRVAESYSRNNANHATMYINKTTGILQYHPNNYKARANMELYSGLKPN